jgi:hypothetical protein
LRVPPCPPFFLFHIFISTSLVCATGSGSGSSISAVFFSLASPTRHLLRTWCPIGLDLSILSTQRIPQRTQPSYAQLKQRDPIPCISSSRRLCAENRHREGSSGDHQHPTSIVSRRGRRRDLDRPDRSRVRIPQRCRRSSAQTRSNIPQIHSTVAPRLQTRTNTQRLIPNIRRVPSIWVALDCPGGGRLEFGNGYRHDL